MKSIPRTRSLVLAALSTALLSTSAYAIETVTVTAEKRSQDVQTVPIAVTAVSAEMLQKAQVKDFNDLQMVAPSLLVSTGSGDTSGGLVRIRGVGTTGNNAGLEASVGVFVDGVYRSRSAAALEDLIDVDHIEILRGPQGTLFGKNTTAGAITISTRKPSQELELEATASGGTLGNYRFTGHISGGVTDDLAFSLAGLVAHRDGFLVDVNDGHRSNSKDHWGVKGQMLWSPNSVVTLRVIGDYMQKADSGSDAPFKIYSTRDRLIQDVIQSPLSTNFGKVFPVPVTLGPSGGANQAVDYKTYRIASNYARISDVNDYGVSAQLDLAFNGATVTLISGYRHFASNDQSDPDYSPGDLLLITNARGLNQTFSEELQVKGVTGSLDWLAGGYLSSEKIQASGPLFWGTDSGLMLAHILNPAGAVGPAGAVSSTQLCILGLANANPACVANGLGGVHAPLYAPGDGYIDHFQTTGSTASAFTHDIWHLNDELDLTLGARVNYERKHGQYDGGQMVWHSAAALAAACGSNVPPFSVDPAHFNPSDNYFSAFNLLCPRAPYNGISTEGSLTGTGNLAWKPNDDMMFYLGYGRGFKTGPWNLDRNWRAAGDPTKLFPAPAAAGYENSLAHKKPEVSDSFELGSRMTFWDGRAIANTTLFYAKFHNFQINSFNGLAFAVENIPHVYSHGLEFEGAVEPIDDLRITAAATWAHSYYGHDTITPGLFGGAPVDRAGKTLTQAPRLTLNGSVGYDTQIATGWRAFFNINANYRSKYNTGSDLNPNKLQEAFALVNAQIGARDEDGMWELTLWGRNIFNKHYNVVAFNTPFQQASATLSATSAISVFPGEPAVYGLTLSFKMH